MAKKTVRIKQKPEGRGAEIFVDDVRLERVIEARLDFNKKTWRFEFIYTREDEHRKPTTVILSNFNLTLE